MLCFWFLVIDYYLMKYIYLKKKKMVYNGLYFFCLFGFCEQVEEILFRKVYYMNGVCLNVNIYVLKEYKILKNLNILKFFILKFFVISFKGGFQCVNDMMEKELCKVF